ncbi:hypothetical protein [uncultured Desulfovibrio sp.]|uniref:hypothetical protein n=1 Tax=uncultured Desulfovibrio sp. TaxID=167968 RepID=UPI002605F073|nr:hypothetical protein [uncultured Desulfovibrio sp.]
MNIDDDFFELMPIMGTHPDISEEEKNEFRKIIKKARYDARKELLGEKCFYCERNIASCNSHFVPKSYLKNIAENGEVFLSHKAMNVDIIEQSMGLNSTGTFRLICRDCDNTIFKDYENFNYDSQPDAKILAQIALKNFLKFIDKRRMDEGFLRRTIKSIAPEIYNLQLEAVNIDLYDYKKEARQIKNFLNNHGNKEYTIVYFNQLDYIIPVAFQGRVAITHDFEGNIINNICCNSKHNNVESMHICMFPLKEKSAVIMFYDSKSNKYRRFRRQFDKFNDKDKLSIVFYIAVKYSEDIFYSKKIDNEVFTNKLFIKASQSNVAGITNIEDKNIRNIKALEAIGKDFDLNKFNSIPNLLAEEYKIK